ncbi:hypothetical protein [Paenibacillus chitinolyticus]|uniref:hypothetical protein n=1 Tax=Paenibacillus chitinolyticus TaxID=79263 RepID=UPI003660F28E
MNIPIYIAEKVTLYIKECGYAEGTISMKLGNLSFLFGNYGQDKMTELLNSNSISVFEAIKFIETTLPEETVLFHLTCKLSS